jgi:hypothetical protein
MILFAIWLVGGIAFLAATAQPSRFLCDGSSHGPRIASVIVIVNCK